jgi:hypothetical protein
VCIVAFQETHDARLGDFFIEELVLELPECFSNSAVVPRREPSGSRWRL